MKSTTLKLSSRGRGTFFKNKNCFGDTVSRKTYYVIENIFFKVWWDVYDEAGIKSVDLYLTNSHTTGDVKQVDDTSKYKVVFDILATESFLNCQENQDLLAFVYATDVNDNSMIATASFYGVLANGTYKIIRNVTKTESMDLLDSIAHGISSFASSAVKLAGDLFNRSPRGGPSVNVMTSSTSLTGDDNQMGHPTGSGEFPAEGTIGLGGHCLGAHRLVSGAAIRGVVIKVV